MKYILKHNIFGGYTITDESGKIAYTFRKKSFFSRTYLFKKYNGEVIYTVNAYEGFLFFKKSTYNIILKNGEIDAMLVLKKQNILRLLQYLKDTIKEKKADMDIAELKNSLGNPIIINQKASSKKWKRHFWRGEILLRFMLGKKIIGISKPIYKLSIGEFWEVEIKDNKRKELILLTRIILEKVGKEITKSNSFQNENRYTN